MTYFFDVVDVGSTASLPMLAVALCDLTKFGHRILTTIVTINSATTWAGCVVRVNTLEVDKYNFFSAC